MINYYHTIKILGQIKNAKSENKLESEITNFFQHIAVLIISNLNIHLRGIHYKNYNYIK